MALVPGTAGAQRHLEHAGGRSRVLALAQSHRLSVTIHEYGLDAADQALADLKAGRFDGAAVLVP